MTYACMEKDLKTFGDDIRTLGRDIDLPLVTTLGSPIAAAPTASPGTIIRQEVIFLLGGAAGYEFRQHEPVQVLGGQFLVVPRGVEHRGVQNVRTPATICGLLLSPDFSRDWRNTPLDKEELRWLRPAPREVRPGGLPLQP